MLKAEFLAKEIHLWNTATYIYTVETIHSAMQMRR
jgi:hypothetical protein